MRQSQMSTTYDPRNDPAEPSGDGIPPEPRVTLGVVMAVTALIPIVGVSHLAPETVGKLLVAMIPLLFIAVSRTSLTAYSVFERNGSRR
jgi:hypothetical protein